MKKTIFTIIITAIICICGTAYAAYEISSNYVTYTDSNNNTIPLNEALDNIYRSLDSKLLSNTFGTTEYQTSQGTPITTRTTSKSVNKGKYLVLVSIGESWNDGGSYAASNGPVAFNSLVCSSNNCTMSRLSGYYNTPKATDPITGNYKAMLYSASLLYYVEIKDNSDTLTATATAAANYTTGAQFVTIQAIPIN